ncbi:MerR family transcriptional regulator [Nocardioides KLBMP 9356]|uniref:MerR family transcriptional regulator n=1 Tax=Nocardioides potassii TaxID=2911371 RepID=A0ABS9H5U5_9ACTN|nr:MerR family transcriptional regulator [Nocardioides potassii]MCF6376612.1 MerR family transcriptional regulator [Nocardioides potassii]
MYTVGRAAELTGVSSTTLRKWEQRYGVVVPQRSAGNYRLYDDEAVRRLSVMRTLVDAGWSAHEAAAHVVDDASAAEAEVARPEPQTPDPRARQLVQCAIDFDVPGLEWLLADVFDDGDHARVVDEWLMPSMVELGKAWQRGEVSVAGEHFVSSAVHRRLAQAFQALPVAPRGPRVVAGLARGSRHELGVLAFSLVLRSRGVPVTYLGGDLPLEAWVGTVRLVAPAAVVLAAPTVEDLPAVREVVEALMPMTTVFLGGAHQDQVVGPERLGHLAGAAATALADRLAPAG